MPCKRERKALRFPVAITRISCEVIDDDIYEFIQVVISIIINLTVSRKLRLRD